MRSSVASFLTAVVLLVGLAATPSYAKGQGSSGSSSSSSSSSGGGQGATPQNSSAGNPGITSGGLPIESVILAYRTLGAGAEKLAAQLGPKLGTSPVVIGTPSDVGAIIQLRILIAQAELLGARLSRARTALAAIPRPSYSRQPQAQGAQSGLGAGFITSPTDIATLIQTLGSISAVNETISEAPGALNDATLVNLVAGSLGNVAYIPSIVPPNLAASADLGGTNLGKALSDLEAKREDAIELATQYKQALQDAQVIAGVPANAPAPAPVAPPGGPLGPLGPRSGNSAPPPAPARPPGLGAARPAAAPAAARRPRNAVQYSPADVRQAGEMAELATTINALVTLITQYSAAVDTLEASLFTGQSNPPTGPQQQTSPNPTLPNPNNPASLLPQPQSSQGQPNAPVPPSGTALQQLVYADLLLSSLPADAASSGKAYFLSLHSLESGGGQLTKSNLFLGSRNYFSGGAVATFALFNGGGGVVCTGVLYGYMGYIRDEKVESEISSASEPQTSLVSNCASSLSGNSSAPSSTEHPVSPHTGSR